MARVMKNIVAFLLLAFPPVCFSQEQWRLEKERNDIAVYTRYDEQGQYKSFKASTLLDAKLEDVVGVLRDIDGYSSWFAYTNKAGILGEDAEGIFIYMETSFPWPFRNEDMIYRMRFMAAGENEVKIDLIGLPGYIPPVAGVNRMKRAGGYISLESSANRTHITYLMHSEPGGNIPIWLVNSGITELPYRTLTNLKRLLMHNKR